MVAHSTMRIYGVDLRRFDLSKAFGSIERVVKSKKVRKRPILHHACATCSELPSYLSTACPRCSDPFHSLFIPSEALLENHRLICLRKVNRTRYATTEINKININLYHVIVILFYYFLIKNVIRHVHDK